MPISMPGVYRYNLDPKDVEIDQSNDLLNDLDSHLHIVLVVCRLSKKISNSTGAHHGDIYL